MRGKRDKFEILEIRPTKHFTAKLKQNYHFFGKETLGIVTSIVGDKPGERSVQFDVYEVKKDGYIVLKTNKGGCKRNNWPCAQVYNFFRNCTKVHT